MQKFYRKIIEKFSRNKIIKRRLNIKDGLTVEWFLSPDSQLKYYKKSFDEDLRKFVEKYVKVSDIVWDIGANCGTFSAFCISKGIKNQILAIEPDIFLSNILVKNSQSYNIFPISAAISNDLSILNLNIAYRGRASNSLSLVNPRGEEGGKRYVQPVISLTLDWLVSIRGIPDIVKLDIEGAELLALQGGKDLMEYGKTKFIVEIDESNLENVIKLFDSYGYVNEEIFKDNFLFQKYV